MQQANTLLMGIEEEKSKLQNSHSEVLCLQEYGAELNIRQHWGQYTRKTLAAPYCKIGTTEKYLWATLRLAKE